MFTQPSPKPVIMNTSAPTRASLEPSGIALTAAQLMCGYTSAT